MEMKARSPMGDQQFSGGGKAPSNPCVEMPLTMQEGVILTLQKGGDIITLL
jgi:hypothetical protein